MKPYRNDGGDILALSEVNLFSLKIFHFKTNSIGCGAKLRINNLDVKLFWFLWKCMLTCQEKLNIKQCVKIFR